jgi:hypothetical protein
MSGQLHAPAALPRGKDPLAGDGNRCLELEDETQHIALRNLGIRMFWSTQICIHRTVVINKQFLYFSTVYFKKNVGK